MVVTQPNKNCTYGINRPLYPCGAWHYFRPCTFIDPKKTVISINSQLYSSSNIDDTCASILSSVNFIVSAG